MEPKKGVLSFGREGKLSPRFIEPFEILRHIGLVAYNLALPPFLSELHDIFHVSMVRKYMTDPIHNYKPLQLNEDLSYEEKPIRILARKVKALCNKNIAFIKVLWRNHHIKEAMWKREDEKKENNRS